MVMKMKINTKYHGEVEINENDIITFDSGIPGFDDVNSYAILPLSEDQVYLVLQSTEAPELAFVITDPFIHYKEYEFSLSEDTIKSLRIGSENEVLVYVILTVNENINETTANLLAPLVINTKSSLAKQIVLHDTKYETKHLLYKNASTGQEDVK